MSRECNALDLYLVQLVTSMGAYLSGTMFEL
jgi:hypothetical protein